MCLGSPEEEGEVGMLGRGGIARGGWNCWGRWETGKNQTGDS